MFGGAIWWAANGFYAGDTLTYWLAAERVLVGHDVYRVRPEDPWLFDIRPFGLYSPPLVVVPWLLLASLPGTAGMIIWWVGNAFAVFWATSVVLLGTRGWAGLLVLPLVPSITLLIGVGNVDGYILASIVATPLLLAGRRSVLAGIVVAIAASVKLTPAVLVVWLIATRRWRALAAAACAVVVGAVVVAVALGPAIFVDYASVMVGGTSGGRPWSLAVAALLLAGVLVLGRRHERLAFSLAIAAIPFGSPVAAGHTWSLLVGAVASWVIVGRSGYRAAGPEATGDATTTAPASSE